MKRALGVVLAIGAFAGTARADVVGPPMVRCGPNEKAVPTHGGGMCIPTSCPPGQVVGRRVGSRRVECIGKAPASCPAGWVGVDGPNCIPALCSEEAPCKGGLECREAPLCTRETEGYGENDVDRASRGLFAAPLPFRKKREYTGSCDASFACEGGDTCRSVRVCLPASASRLAPKPANAAPAMRLERLASEKVLGAGADAGDGSVAPGPAAAADASAPATTSPVAMPVPSSPPPKPADVPPQSGRGSAGCSTAGGGEGSLAALGVVLALGLARSRRRTTNR